MIDFIPRPPQTDQDSIEAFTMNPIAAFLGLVCVAAGAATAFRTNIYLALPFVVVASGKSSSFCEWASCKA
jgi:hypothetical protein